MLWPNRSTFISFGYFNRAICFSMNSCVSIKIFRLYRKVSGSSISVTLIVYELINARAFSKADAMVGAGNRFESSGPATRQYLPLGKTVCTWLVCLNFGHSAGFQAPGVVDHDLRVPGMLTGVKSSWPMPSALWNLYLWRWTALALSTRTWNSSAPMSGRTTI